MIFLFPWWDMLIPWRVFVMIGSRRDAYFHLKSPLPVEKILPVEIVLACVSMATIRKFGGEKPNP